MQTINSIEKVSGSSLNGDKVQRSVIATLDLRPGFKPIPPIASPRARAYRGPAKRRF